MTCLIFAKIPTLILNLCICVFVNHSLRRSVGMVNDKKGRVCSISFRDVPKLVRKNSEKGVVFASNLGQ